MDYYTQTSSTSREVPFKINRHNPQNENRRTKPRSRATSPSTSSTNQTHSEQYMSPITIGNQFLGVCKYFIYLSVLLYGSENNFKQFILIAGHHFERFSHFGQQRVFRGCHIDNKRGCPTNNQHVSIRLWPVFEIQTLSALH